MNGQAHEGIPWFASRPKFLPSCEGSCRTRAGAAETGPPPDAGIARRQGGHGGQVWTGHRAARGWDHKARGRTRGRLAGCPPCAGVSSSSIIYDVMSLAGGGLWRERSWLLPRKLVLFLPYDLFACVISLQILFEQCLMCFFHWTSINSKK